ncbi:hypothetical protein BLX87_13720 [Bacillus sp. VT-16-64]|nr:hypothetical protein BLX87_13720 [Bacillus sp. VT-16-64]
MHLFSTFALSIILVQLKNVNGKSVKVSLADKNLLAILIAKKGIFPNKAKWLITRKMRNARWYCWMYETR